MNPKIEYYKSTPSKNETSKKKSERSEAIPSTVHTIFCYFFIAMKTARVVQIKCKIYIIQKLWIQSTL